MRVDVRREEGAGVALVRDSGVGLLGGRSAAAPAAPFSASTGPAQVTGAGLGLAIAMELARRMGGAMRISLARARAAPWNCGCRAAAEA